MRVRRYHDSRRIRIFLIIYSVGVLLTGHLASARVDDTLLRSVQKFDVALGPPGTIEMFFSAPVDMALAMDAGEIIDNMDGYASVPECMYSAAVQFRREYFQKHGYPEDILADVAERLLHSYEPPLTARELDRITIYLMRTPPEKWYADDYRGLMSQHSQYRPKDAQGNVIVDTDFLLPAYANLSEALNHAYHSIPDQKRKALAKKIHHTEHGLGKRILSEHCNRDGSEKTVSKR